MDRTTTRTLQFYATPHAWRMCSVQGGNTESFLYAVKAAVAMANMPCPPKALQDVANAKPKLVGGGKRHHIEVEFTGDRDICFRAAKELVRYTGGCLQWRDLPHRTPDEIFAQQLRVELLALHPELREALDTLSVCTIHDEITISVTAHFTDEVKAAMRELSVQRLQSMQIHSRMKTFDLNARPTMGSWWYANYVGVDLLRQINQMIAAGS